MESIDTPRLRLVLLNTERIAALLAELPPWAEPRFPRFLQLRLDQLRADPSYAPWAPRLIIAAGDDATVVGHLGFHGPPGTNAVSAPSGVEIGYTILEPFRRRGYATEAVRAAISWALEQPGVDRVIASVAPTNEPSLALVRRLGFVEVGRHWDEEDGEELEFELVSGAP